MGQSATAKPARATQERSRDTQARILNAAIQALVSDGYAGATTLRIQELAGVSRGRLLHHYPSRDDLLVAAVSHLTEARMLALAEDEEWPHDLSQRVDVAVDRMWETFHQDYFWASTELWLAARANERLREALGPHERRLNTFIVQKLGTFFGESVMQNPSFPMVRDLLITSMRGVALSYSFRPRDPDQDPHVAQWKTMARSHLLPDPS